MSLPRELFTISRVSEMTGFPPDRLAWLEDELGEEFRVRRTPAGNRLFTQALPGRLLLTFRFVHLDVIACALARKQKLTLLHADSSQCRSWFEICENPFLDFSIKPIV